MFSFYPLLLHEKPKKLLCIRFSCHYHFRFYFWEEILIQAENKLCTLIYYFCYCLLVPVFIWTILSRGEFHPEASFVLGRFPFVRTNRPDHSSQNENFTFNQNYPAKSVKSLIVCTKEMVFQQKLLEKSTFFIVKMTGPAMVRPASSDFWKVPLVSG